MEAKKLTKIKSSQEKAQIQIVEAIRQVEKATSLKNKERGSKQASKEAVKSLQRRIKVGRGNNMNILAPYCGFQKNFNAKSTKILHLKILEHKKGERKVKLYYFYFLSFMNYHGLIDFEVEVINSLD